MQTLYADLIEKYKELYKDADKAIPGMNGPYGQQETYARNTAHWIITFSYMYNKTKEQSYKKIVERFTKSLVNDINLSGSGAIRCFELGEGLSVNGLIGFAWIIEGLVTAHSLLQDDAILDAAEKMYFSQPYNNALHTWEIVDTDGNNLGTDLAFNHSLWFCYAGAKLCKNRQNSEIDRQVTDFLDHIDKHFLIYRNGLISHFDVNGSRKQYNVKMKLRKRILGITGSSIPFRNDNSVEYERAYHLFSIYAFAWLYRLRPKTAFFNSPKFKKAVTYGLDKKHFIEFPNKDKFAYGYNSPAYELPMAEYVFGSGQHEELEADLARLHVIHNINAKTGEYSENVPDKEVLNARVYEIVQYYRMKEESANEEK